MANAFKIERGVSIPPDRRGAAIYPFGEMAPGDSFLAPNGANAIRAAHGYGKRHGQRFTSRKVEGGVRIWRIA